MNIARRALALLCACLLIAGGAPIARAERLSEPELKAALIVNILLFIQWPAGRLANGEPFHLCLFEGGAIEQALARSEGQRIHGGALTIQRVDKGSNRLAECEAVFVPGHSPHDLARAAVASRTANALVVSEGERSLQGGAGVALSQIGNRVVFDIDLQALRAAGLSASSKLLRLARAVVE